MPAHRTDSSEVRYSRTIRALRVRDDDLREVVESIPAATVIVDADGTVRHVNASARTMFGCTERAAEPVEIADLIPEAPFLVRSSDRISVDPRPRVVGPIAARVRDGSEIEVEVSLRSITLGGHDLILLTFCDVSRQVVAEREIVRLAGDLRMRLEELGDAVRAKDLLLREIHHRVKNNLQIVSSLLSLQSRQVDDPEARRLFEDSRDRLISMSLVHEQLYRGSDLGRVDFAAYLKNLVAGIARGHVDETRGIAISVRADPIGLPIDRAVPAGLIVHELVSNALKHAFPGGGPGSISVSFTRFRGGDHELVVSDDGVGARLPATTSRSFGTRLVSLLSRQLEAESEVSTDGGTTVRIRFRDSVDEEKS